MDISLAKGFLELPTVRKSLMSPPNKIGQSDVVEALAAICERNMIYVPSADWHFWDGSRYKPAQYSKVYTTVYYYASHLFREPLGPRLSNAFIKGVMEIMQNDPRFRVESAFCDQNNMLLNTPNCLVDLLTGEELVADQSHLITCLTSVAPSKTGGEVFNGFLDQVTVGDETLKSFLQVLLGSVLSGAVERHWIAFFIGSGANGKSTLMDVIKWVLGDYAAQIKSETLMSQTQHSANANPDIMRLRGKRLVLSSEISKSAYLDDEKVKSLTGDATITARKLYSDEIEFNRTHKHIVLGNNTPRTREISNSMGRRVKVVPFNFTATIEDPDLPEKLRYEGGYILWWLIQGHVKWIEMDKTYPDCDLVTDSTRAYFEEQPTPEQWLRQYCEYDENPLSAAAAYVSVSDAHNHYTVVWRAQGYTPLSMQQFIKALSYIPKKKSGPTRLMGVKLKVDNPYEALRLGT
jgi:putative DNA primase/helicase